MPQAAVGQPMVQVGHRLGRGAAGQQGRSRFARHAGHQQGGGEPLARDITQRDDRAAIGQRDVVEQVAPHAAGRTIDVEHRIPGQGGSSGRKETLLHLDRELQITIELDLGQGLFVQSGILNRQRRLGADRGQQVEIFLPKRLPQPEAVELDGPLQAPGLARQRHAHERPNPQIRHALGHVPRVAQRVVAQQRLRLRDRRPQDRGADPLGVQVVPLRPQPTRLDLEICRVRLRQDHHPPIGLREDLEQAGENPREHQVQSQLPSQVAADLENGPQLLLGANVQFGRSRGREFVSHGRTPPVFHQLGKWRW